MAQGPAARLMERRPETSVSAAAMPARTADPARRRGLRRQEFGRAVPTQWIPPSGSTAGSGHVSPPHELTG